MTTHVTLAPCRILLCLLTASGFASAQLPADAIDGLYFLPANPGSSRLFLHSERTFVSSVGPHHRIVGRTYWNGVEGAAELRGYLSLSYFDGQQLHPPATTRASCAVLDGELWVGVLLRGAGRGDWTSTLDCPGIFSAEGAGLPRGRVTWNEHTGDWGFQPTGRPRSAMRKLSGVTTGPALDAGEEQFALRFPKSPFGMGPIAPRWTRRHYQRRGDVIVTPWSIRLGRVGLMPRRVAANKVIGPWQSPDAKIEVAEEVPPVPLFWGPQPTPKPGAVPVIPFQPDARGISFRSIPFAGHPPMSHGDYPIHEYALVAEDGRLVRYRFGGGCNGQVPAKGPDVFRRAADRGR